MSGDSGNAPILVVEDDPELRQVIRTALEEEGFVVVTAADGRAALETLRRRHPSLLILDTGLRRLDGERLAAGLPAAPGEAPPILAITAGEQGTSTSQGPILPAQAHVEKPFELDDLLATVRRLLAGRERLS